MSTESVGMYYDKDIEGINSASKRKKSEEMN